MNNREKVDQVISVKMVLWKLLEQWKMVLIVAVIFALLCPMIMHLREMKVYEAEKQQIAAIELERKNSHNIEDNPYADNEKAERIDTYLLSLQDNEREDVERLVQMKESYFEIQQYMDKSALMQIDPSRKHTLRMEYAIVLPEENSQYIRSLTNAYIRNLNSNIVNVMEEKFDSEIENTYLQELVDVSSETEQTNMEMSGRLVIELIIPEGMDVSHLQSDVESLVNEQRVALEESICPHSLQQFWNSERTAADYSLITRQMDIYSRYTGLKNNISTFENALTPEQKEVYDSIVSQVLLEDDIDIEEQEKSKEDLTVPGYSKKWAAIGFVLGIIVYAVLYLIYLAIWPRLRTKEEVQDGWKIRVLGEIYLYSKKGVQRFAESKAIFNLRHKGKNDVDRQIEVLIESLHSISKHNDIEQLSLIPVALEDDVQKCFVYNQVLEKIVKKLASSALSVYEGKLFIQDDLIDEKLLLERKNIVPVIIGGISTYQMMNTLMSDAKVYDVNLIGSVMLES